MSAPDQPVTGKRVADQPEHARLLKRKKITTVTRTEEEEEFLPPSACPDPYRGLVTKAC